MSTIDQLLVVQDHDIRILQIEKVMKDIPARKDRELERLSGNKAALAESEESFKAQQSRLKQLEVDVGSKRGKITKLRGQQIDLKTNKEFKAMEKEIKTIEKSIKSDEDRELEIMEDIETARAHVELSRKELATENEDVQLDIKDLDERVADLQAELGEEQAARIVSADGIDAEWMTRYNGIMKSKGGYALVSASKGVCGGCFMTLPPYLRIEAKKQLRLVVCSFCGRMLY